MLCQKCNKTIATVHVTEIEAWNGVGNPANLIHAEHLCEACSQLADLPFAGVPQPMGGGVWNLINVKAKAACRPVLACHACKMDLDEFRRVGRLGCETCYEVFAEPLEEMLERMHGATQHVGRVPRADQERLERQERERRTSELRCELESAIQEEAYERAAGLRDELRSLGADDESTPA